MKDLENDRCTLEEITLNHSARQYVVLPEIIFQTDDIILIGAGSFSCVRALYRTAVKKRAVGRFYYRVITPEQYALGQAEEMIQQLMETALKRTDAGGIIYYASCMDVVSKIDFRKIKEKIDNPHHIPIEVLFRGPMVRRYLDSNKKLTELLLGIPVSKTALKNDRYDLPPMMPDFEAICGVLQSWDVYRFLISSGGCDGCISGTGKNDQDYQVTKSRVDDIQIAMGCERLIENGIIWDYKNKKCKNTACITGAGLPKLISFHYERVIKRIQEENIDCVMLKSDGFHFAQQGIADMYLTLFQKYAAEDRRKKKLVGIIGANCFSSVQEEEIRESILHIKRLGYEVIWPEESKIEETGELMHTACSWVVASEGIPLAKYLYRKYGIPYMIGIPSGKRFVSVWQKFLSKGQMHFCESNHSGQPGEKILLIGDPAVTWGIGKYISEISSAEVIFAVYAQLASVKSWYSSVLRDTEEHWLGGDHPCGKIHYFKDRFELKELFQDADIIFGELLLKMSFNEEELLHKKWIDLPTPVLNCGIRTDRYEYHLFGGKGARWIHTGIDNRVCN